MEVTHDTRKHVHYLIIEADGEKHRVLTEDGSAASLLSRAREAQTEATKLLQRAALLSAAAEHMLRSAV